MAGIAHVITPDSASGAQIIDGSLKFQKAHKKHLSRTPGSAGNQKTWTLSLWFKKQNFGDQRILFNAFDDNSNRVIIRFMSDKLQFALQTGGTFYGLQTNQVFRDNGWYHVVLFLDTTQSTDTERQKIYLNGNRIADADLTHNSISGTNKYPTQDSTFTVNNTDGHYIGANYESAALQDTTWDGHISNVYLIDGQALDASYFGFTDGLTNTWKPKKYEGTFGTNGFWLPMDGSAPIGEDKSGQGNDFTPLNFGGSIALDNPQVSGARPILNTLPGGTQAGVGVFGSKQNVGYAVTVYDDGGGNKYYIDGVKQATLTGLIRGATYTFDTSDSTIGSTHPFRFSESDGGSEYTNGVAAITGTATTITIPYNASNELYYYCTSHSGMGSSITGITTNEKLADQYASNCTLAAPLVGAAGDVSVSVACTSTPKTATVTNANSSSTQSNFYGGSFDFDGSGDYISYGTSSEMDFGSGDCTVECWLYINSHAGDKTIVGSWEGNISWQLSYGATGDQNRFSFMMYDGSTTSANSSELSTNYAGKWVHLAGVRNGNELQIWVNGKKDGTASFSGAHNSLNSAIRIGGRSSGNQTDAHIQDVRIYKGVAKYTSNFVVPSRSPDILPDTPSGVSGGSKLAKITDGAVSFDGTGDYLGLANTTDVNFGSGDFTWECFAYFHTVTGSISLMGQWENSTNRRSWLLQLNDGKMQSYLSSSGNSGGDAKQADSPANYMAANRWYHIAVTRSSNDMNLFIDGELITTTDLTGFTVYANTDDGFSIGSQKSSASNVMNGFISNARIIKGTALYTSRFTPPTAPLTDVTNTKLLCCQSNTSATEGAVKPGTITANGDAAATIFNPFNTDINTVRGQETGYATLNPLNTMGDITLSDGNLHGKFTGSSSNRTCGGTIGVSTGNWYYEATLKVAGGSHPFCGFVTSISISPGSTSNLSVASMAGSVWTGNGGLSAGDVVGNILDFSGKVGMGATYYATINGAPVYSSSSTVKSEPTELTEGYKWIPAVSGLDNAEWEINFGQKPFKFPPPDGFQPLNAANTRPVKVISRPDQYVGVTTWSGNGVSQNIIGLKHKPDFVWIKKRAGGTARSNQLFDSIRGVHETLHSDSNGAQDTNSNRLTAFNQDGFAVGGDDGCNGSSGTFVGWTWKAGGNKNTFNVDDVGYASAAAAGLTAGDTTVTGASVGTKQGFSIIKYTGPNDTSNHEVPHGLSQAPDFIITKNLDDTYNWDIYHSSLADDAYLIFTNAATRAQGFNGRPTSTVFKTEHDYSTDENDDYIAYCWHDVPGLQKFGTYEANGSTDGPYVELGFTPAILMLKNYDDTEHWYVYDPERSPHNVAYQSLLWSNNGAENTGTSDTRVDLLSNGFKLRQANGPNTSGDGYIYAAWAAAPTIDLFGGGANAR